MQFNYNIYLLSMQRIISSTDRQLLLDYCDGSIGVESLIYTNIISQVQMLQTTQMRKHLRMQCTQLVVP